MRLSVKQAGLPLVLCLFLCFALTCLWPSSYVAAASTDAEALDVKTESGGGVRAVAHVIFPAKPALIQSMLTDYLHWPELFDVRMRIADLKIQNGVATMDLRIEHALLPGERRLITESRTLPEGGIVTDLVGGDFKQYHRVWKLTARNDGGGTTADFELVVAIDSIVPDWLVALGIRRELETHFRIVKEKAIERSKRER
jgi:hypothetical protein